MQFIRERNLLMLKDSRRKTTSSSSSHRILKFPFSCYDSFLRAYTSAWMILLNFAWNTKALQVQRLTIHKQKDSKANTFRELMANCCHSNKIQFCFDMDTINEWFDKLTFSAVNLGFIKRYGDLCRVENLLFRFSGQNFVIYILIFLWWLIESFVETFFGSSSSSSAAIKK